MLQMFQDSDFEIDISVIICTYNRAESLSETLENLEQLDLPSSFSWEILVVDNNSNDSTSDVVTDRIRKGKLPIRYLFEPKQGKMYAANRGVRESRGRIIAFTDDDVLFETGWIRNLLEAFEEYDCVGVGGRVVASWHFSMPDWLTKPGMKELANLPIVSHDLGNVSKMYDRSGMPMPVGANLAFCRGVFEQWGWFRTDLDRTGRLILGGGDTEFCRRILDWGGKLMYCPSAIVYHPVEPHRVTKRYFRRWMWGGGRSIARMQSKIQPGKTLFGVPFWQYRELIQLAARYLKHKVSLNPRRHSDELPLIRQLGIIYEKMRQHIAQTT